MKAIITTGTNADKIRTIEGCIKALENEPEVAYKIGNLTVDFIVEYLSDYKNILQEDK